MRADLRERSVGTWEIVEEDAEKREYTVSVRDAGGRALGMLRWPFEDVAAMTSGSSEENPSDLWERSGSQEFFGPSNEVGGAEQRALDSRTIWLADGASCRLREAPSSSPPREGALLEGTREIKAENWTVVDGYMKVTAEFQDGRPPVTGWIDIGLLVGYMSYMGHREFRALTDVEWYEERWLCRSSDLTVWVSQGGETWDSIVDELMRLGTLSRDQTQLDKETKRHARLLQEIVEESGYTYVALGLGKPYNEMWEVCSTMCHITIAYAAIMPEIEMKKLRQRMEAVVQEWPRLLPSERPWRLIRCKRFYFQKMPDPRGTKPWAYDKVAIAKKEWRTVHRWLEEGKLSSILPDPDDPAEFKEHVARIWERDQARIEEARVRASILEPHRGVLEMAQCGSGLGEISFEMEDLLEYLADQVRYFASASRRNDKDKLITPFITAPSRWHCTKQGEWKMARAAVPLQVMD